MARRNDSSIISVVHPICCGLDVHKEKISACLIRADKSGREEALIEEFQTYTDQLIRLRDWLIEHDCPVVAMENTGVYWWPGAQCARGLPCGNPGQCPPCQEGSRQEDGYIG